MGFTQNTGGSKIRSQVWLKGVGAQLRNDGLDGFGNS